MRRRPNAVLLAATIAFLALGTIVAPRTAAAQDLSGTYRVTADQTTVQIPEWGTDCGPRPSSRTGNVGREATVTSDGSQIAIQDGRHRYRTDGCWSDNPRARRISASHTGSRWTVICQTPDEDYQHEQGTYTITVDGTHVTMRESTEYAWQLRESRCRASASRTLTYERTSGAAVTPAVVDAGTAHATTNTPPPTNRCANAGAPTRLSLSPSRRSLAPGGRGCFRARFYDANNCEVSTGLPSVTWSMTRSGAAGAGDATMENGCVAAPAGMAVAEYNVTASGGAFTATGIAAIVSAEELRNLVATNFEDEEADAGVGDAGPAVAASGSGVGAVVVTPPPAPAPESRGLGAILWVLMGIGALLAVAGVVLLTSRKKPARKSSAPSERVSDPSPARPRRDPAPAAGKELPRAKKPLGEAPPMQPVVAPQIPPAVQQPLGAPAIPAAPAAKGAAYVQASRPLVKKCPVCNQRFTAENAFCPEHGTALVMVESQPVSSATMIAGSSHSGSATLCPRCGQPVDPGAQFCPRDGTPVLAAPAPPLPLVCPRCQRRFPDGTAFCGDDGSPLLRG